MAYPKPVRMKTRYTLNTKALKYSMMNDNRSRILDSVEIQKAFEKLGEGSYKNMAAYSLDQAVNNLCQEKGVPVYARGAFLDEVDRYSGACITEGSEVYPSKSVLITWLSRYHADDKVKRAPGETKADAYRRINAGMKRKFRGNSSHQKRKLIEEYENALVQTLENRGIASEPGPVDDGRVVSRTGAPAQLSLGFTD